MYGSENAIPYYRWDMSILDPSFEEFKGVLEPVPNAYQGISFSHMISEPRQEEDSK